MGSEPHGAARVNSSGCEIAACLRSLDEREGAVRRSIPQPPTRQVLPLLEFGRSRNEEPFEQVSLIEVERLLPASILHCFIELHGIAANRAEIEAHNLVSPGFDDIRSES